MKQICIGSSGKIAFASNDDGAYIPEQKLLFVNPMEDRTSEQIIKRIMDWAEREIKNPALDHSKAGLSTPDLPVKPFNVYKEV